jgi:TolB-like protein/Flp pilus assembly protein TadD
LRSDAVFCGALQVGYNRFSQPAKSWIGLENAMPEPTFEVTPSEKAPEKRLDSWKEIAAYLNRDVTTVQRWEKKEGMPVHRHLHDKRGSVYALPEEIDAWQRGRRPPPFDPENTAAQGAPTGKPEPALSSSRARLWIAFAAPVSIALLATAYFAFQHRPERQPPPSIHSLAVLPFRNLSGDSSQDYLADGFTEALIGRLASIRDLRVISHTSVLRFRNPQVSVPEIAKELGVGAVVEGSVTREGTHIRVTAQLIRGPTDEHFWSQTYDREMRDALTLESELAQAIADKVEVTVTGEEQRVLTAARPISPEMYESYLKGLYALSEGNSKARIEESIQDFNSAIARDPAYAPAYLGLAQAYVNLGTVFAGVAPSETRPKAIAAARKALELDPTLADAHRLLANVLQEEWEWPQAEAEYKRALELAPNDASVSAEYAAWLSCQGRVDEAVNLTKRARELDPVAVDGAYLSWMLFQARRYDEAIREARSSLAVQPNSAHALFMLGFALNANNQAADAVPVLEKADSLSQGSPAVEGVLVRAYALAGRRNDGLRVLANLKQRRSKGYVPAAAFVNAYLGLDDKEQAFAALEQAYKEKSNILQFVKTHPYFDPLRSDPRFMDLVRRVGLG